MNFWRNHSLEMGAAITAAGIVLILLGVWGIWLWEGAPQFIVKIHQPDRWDVLMFVAGIFLVFGAGWETIDLVVAKRKLMKLLETKKRSEFLGNKDEIKEILARLPKKYEALVTAKEEELGIK